MAETGSRNSDELKGMGWKARGKAGLWAGFYISQGNRKQVNVGNASIEWERANIQRQRVGVK